MISLVGWGLVVAGWWVAREVARAREKRQQPALQPVPVRNNKPRRAN